MNWRIALGLCVVGGLTACSSESSNEPEPAEGGDITRQQSAHSDKDRLPGADGSFLMRAGDVFTITGRGVVVTGFVERGSLSVGESVCIAGGSPVTVTGIEMFRKVLDRVSAGENAGLLFADISKEDVAKGDEIRHCD